MKSLCIDTSAGSSVAVCHGEEVLARRHSADPRKHAELLAPMVQQELEAAKVTVADLDAVIVGTGPAPYTGLRAGIITAQMFARATGLPLYGISPLTALARQVLDLHPQATVLVATDARRREVYFAVCRAAGEDDVRTLAGPEVGRAEVAAEIAAEWGATVVVGAGAELYSQVLPPTPGVPQQLDVAAFPRVVTARLAAGRGDDLAVAPRYLRRPDVSVPQAAKRVT